MKNMPSSSSPLSGGNRKNLILTLLIAAAFVFALPFIVPYADDAGNDDAVLGAGPVNPTASTTWDFRTVDANGSGSYGVGSWSWVQSSKTLTLTNFTYTTSASIAVRLKPGTTIVLSGTNKITGGDSSTGGVRGIACTGENGNITISGFAGSSLDVTSGNSTAPQYGSSHAIYAEGTINIIDHAKVNAKSGTAPQSSSGIQAGSLLSVANITISGNADVTATGGTASDSYGISSRDNIIINGNATVTATGGNTASGGTSSGINSEESITIGGDATVTAQGGSSPNGRGISSDGPITINGNAVVEANGGAAMGYGINSSGSITIGGSAQVTASGNTRAINKDYTVPSGYTYYVNTSPGPSTASLTGNGSTTVIGITHLYAKIIAVPPVAPTITSANSTTVANGTGGTFQVTATGATPITYSLAGAPSGVTINSSTGSITIMGAVAAGTYTFTVNASNEAVPNATQSFTLTVTAPVPALTGTVNFNVNASTGEVTASASDGNTATAGTLTYTWTGGATGTGTSKTPTLGSSATCTVTASGAYGSIYATVTVYQVGVTASGNVGGDTVSTTPQYGKAGDVLSIDYTVANTHTNNMLTYGGVAVAPAQVTAAGIGTSSYTVSAGDASFSGTISISAAFAHSNNPILTGTVNLSINVSTGEVTASAPDANTYVAGTLTYTWTGGATGTGASKTPTLGSSTTCTVTASDADGSISATITVYRVTNGP
ncbi:MAG: putative Ig domain-containing protein, partial [Methanomassiliicoccaceae archaeon]|nr:putative Ig domain-containing protein [Methanomassiliicoccaceae archaeon]